MKRSPQGKTKKRISKVPRVRRDDAIDAFRKLGYEVDIPHPQVTVLRETDFPFRRIALPNQKRISLALIKIHLKEVGIDIKRFVEFVNG